MITSFRKKGLLIALDSVLEAWSRSKGLPWHGFLSPPCISNIKITENFEFPACVPPTTTCVWCLCKWLEWEPVWVGEGAGGGGGGGGVFVGCHPSNLLLYLKDGHAQTIVRVATWDGSCRSILLSHLVTVYWRRTSQSQLWLYNARRLAGQALDYQFLGHWYDSTKKNKNKQTKTKKDPRRKRKESNPGLLLSPGRHLNHQAIEEVCMGGRDVTSLRDVCVCVCARVCVCVFKSEFREVGGGGWGGGTGGTGGGGLGELCAEVFSSRWHRRWHQVQL